MKWRYIKKIKNIKNKTNIKNNTNIFQHIISKMLMTILKITSRFVFKNILMPNIFRMMGRKYDG